MGFGTPQPGGHAWVITEEEALAVVKRALDRGVTFFDTANVYSAGTSEEFLGRALKKLGAERHRIVVATKVNGKMAEGPNGAGLSRKTILAEVENSLRRLGTDFIDLYQIHRWDYSTPIEETMETLHDLLRAGKVRYIGASAMRSYQFLKAQHAADVHGWTRFVSMQDHYNLLYREEEREMLPLCREDGTGVIPYNPLAGGRLTRDWSETTRREETDKVLHSKYDATRESDRPVVEALAEIAARRGVPRARVGLAWLLQKAPVTAPIVGATKEMHVDDAVAALDLKLTVEEISSLEEPYVPHPVVGHQ